MPDQIALIQEAYNRGILPDSKKPLYEEAVRRGLIPPPGPGFIEQAGIDADNNAAAAPAPQTSDLDLYNQAQAQAGQKMAVEQQANQQANNAGRGQLASAAIELLHPAGQVMAGAQNLLAPVVGAISPEAGQNMRDSAQALQDVRGADNVGGTVGGLVGNLPVYMNPALAGGVAAGETYHNIEQQKAAGANISGGAETLDVVGQGVLNAAMSKLFGGNVTGGATKAIADKLAAYVPDLIAKYGARAAVGALINGAQGVASNTVTKATVDPNVGITDGLGKNLLLGAGMETGMGALHDFAGRGAPASDGRTPEQIAQDAADAGGDGTVVTMNGKEYRPTQRKSVDSTVVDAPMTDDQRAQDVIKNSTGDTTVTINGKTTTSADPLAGATFESPTGTDPATEARLNATEEAPPKASLAERPKGDLSFSDPHQARTIAEARAGTLDKPMYIYPGEGGKYVVDSRQPDFQAVRVLPGGKFEMADPVEAKVPNERRGKGASTLDAAGVADVVTPHDPDVKDNPGDSDTAAAMHAYYKGEIEHLDGGTGKLVLTDIPVDKFDLKDSYQPDALNEYKTLSPDTRPPIVAGVREGKNVIVDGNTRAAAAKARGETTIKGYVPEATAAEWAKPAPVEHTVSAVPVGGGQPDLAMPPKPPEQVRAETEAVQKQVEPVVQKTTPLAGTKYKTSLVARTANNLFTPIMNRVRDISPRIFDRMMRTMEFEPGLQRENEARLLTPVVQRMTERLGGPKTPEYKAFWLAVRNGDFEAAKRIGDHDYTSRPADDGKVQQLGKPETLKSNNQQFRDDFDQVTEMLDRFHTLQSANGVKIGKLANYWPDYVTDYKGLDAVYGDNKGLYEDAWDTEAKRIGRPLDDREKMEVVNSVQQGYGPRKPGSVGPAHTRTRTVDTVSGDQLQYRLDPFAALYRYIDGASRAAGRAKFLGKSADIGTLQESIGDVIQKEIDGGHLDKSKQEELKAVLTSRLMGDSLYMHPLIKKTKDLTHLATLGQIHSTLNQVLDFAVTASDHGLGATVKGLREAIKITPAERKIVLEDAGMHEYGEEYRDISNVGKVASKALALTGFRKLDRIGKETRMNAAYTAMETAAKDPDGEGFKRLSREYKGVLGDQFDSTMADLRAGRKTENVRYLAMLDLTRVQPVTLSNMPKAYLDNPNGRILYTLKTFQIQQLDWLRRGIIKNLATPGQRREGLSKLAGLTVLTTMLGVGKEVLQDLIKGQDIDPARLGSHAVDSMLGLVGMSTFQLSKLADKPVAATLGLITPPLAFMDDVWGDLKTAGDGKGVTSLRYLPAIGDPLYYWAPFGKGSITAPERAKKEFKQRLNALHTDAYRAYQSGDTETAHDAIQSYNGQRPQGTKPLSMGDLRYLPPSSEEARTARTQRKQAVQAYKAGDVNAARDLLTASNKGSRTPGTISIIKKKAVAEGSQR